MAYGLLTYGPLRSGLFSSPVPTDAFSERCIACTDCLPGSLIARYCEGRWKRREEDEEEERGGGGIFRTSDDAG